VPRLAQRSYGRTRRRPPGETGDLGSRDSTAVASSEFMIAQLPTGASEDFARARPPAALPGARKRWVDGFRNQRLSSADLRPSQRWARRSPSVDDLAQVIDVAERQVEDVEFFDDGADRPDGGAGELQGRRFAPARSSPSRRQAAWKGTLDGEAALGGLLGNLPIAVDLAAKRPSRPHCAAATGEKSASRSYASEIDAASASPWQRLPARFTSADHVHGVPSLRVAPVGGQRRSISGYSVMSVSGCREPISRTTAGRSERFWR
jgi:hypothetical protein